MRSKKEKIELGKELARLTRKKSVSEQINIERLFIADNNIELHDIEDVLVYSCNIRTSGEPY